MKEEGCFWRTTARESLNRPAVCFLKFITAHIKRVDQIHSTVGVCVCVCVRERETVCVCKHVHAEC